MAKYKLTNKAVEDLTDIWDYTFENWSERQADKYYQLLIESFTEIAENPFLGKNFDTIIESLRGFKVGRHVVFYWEIEERRIEILRILHDHMDLKNRLVDK
jgi:toxin ParE1/3/4